VLVVLIAVAAVICVLYLLCWIFSKQRRVAWLIVGLVFFALDTVFMLLGGISADRILDIVFHGWVIISLTGGIIAHSKLKKLPAEEPAPVAESVQTEETDSGEELTQS
jgi:thiol:disulfide interchange protein